MTTVIKNKPNNFDFILNKELNEIKSIPDLEIKSSELSEEDSNSNSSNDTKKKKKTYI